MHIPYGKQNINQKDIDYVIKVLKSDFLTQGPMVPAFELAFSKRINSKFCFAVNVQLARCMLPALR